MASEEEVVVAPPLVEDDDVVLGVAGEGEPESTPAPAKEPETPAAEPMAKEPEATPAEPVKPQPGTPDPILHKIQMENAAIQGQLTKLLERVEKQGGQATALQAAQAKVLEAKAEEVKDTLAVLLAKKQEEIDPFTDLLPVAQRVIDNGKRSDEFKTAAEKRIADLEARLEKFESKTQADDAWSLVQQEYSGVSSKELHSLFDECVKDAQAIMGDNPAAVQKLADYNFHTKAAAAKAEKAKPAAEPNKPSTPAARNKPPVTPSGASVTVKNGVNRPSAPATASEDDWGDDVRVAE